MVVDGGGNHIYSLIQQRKDQDVENFTIPNVISGDFDSVKANVLEFYRKNDTILVHTPDQNKTDFFKALEVLVSTTKVRTVYNPLESLNILYSSPNKLLSITEQHGDRIL